MYNPNIEVIVAEHASYPGTDGREISERLYDDAKYHLRRIDFETDKLTLFKDFISLGYKNYLDLGWFEVRFHWNDTLFAVKYTYDAGKDELTQITEKEAKANEGVTRDG